MNNSFPLYRKAEEGLISSEEFIVVNDAFTVVWIIISFIGVVTNAINIKTFMAIGLADGITVTFFVLSITDFGFTSASFILGSSSIFTVLEVKYGFKFPIQPFAVTMFAANVGLILYAITGLTTTFLAVARCMCVAKPFIFKNVFTRERSIFALVCFVIISFACYIPILSEMGTEYRFDGGVNRTRVMLWLSSNREDVKDIVSIIFDTIFSFITQVVIIICIMVMAESLRSSVRFRLEASSTGKAEDMKPGQKLSGKELQVVQQVVLISAIYIVCTLPKMFNAVYSLLETDFDVNKKFHNLYFSMSYLRTATELLNSASTFPIYYAYNSKFRSLCLRI